MFSNMLERRKLLIFCYISIVFLIAINLISNWSAAALQKEACAQRGALSLLRFETPLPQYIIDSVKKSFKKTPYCYQKSLPATLVQKELFQAINIHAIYDKYPLVGLPIIFEQDVLLINQALANTLDPGPVQIGHHTFSSWKVLNPSLAWNTIEHIRPTVWLNKEQFHQCDLLKDGVHYSDDFYLNTRELPANVLNYYQDFGGHFERIYDQKDFLADIQFLLDSTVSWFLGIVIMAQALSLWLLLVKEQEQHRPVIFYHRWYNLKWPWVWLIQSSCLRELAFFMICAALAFTVATKNIAELFSHSVQEIIILDLVMYSSVVVMMSSPWGYKKSSRLFTLATTLMIGFLAGYYLGTSQSSWLLCIFFTLVGLLSTLLLFFIAGFILQVGERNWPLGLIGVYWQRTSFRLAWPQAIMVSTLCLTVIFSQIGLTYVEYFYNPIKSTQNNFFILNVPTNKTLNIPHEIKWDKIGYIEPSLLLKDGIPINIQSLALGPEFHGDDPPLHAFVIQNELPEFIQIIKGNWPVEIAPEHAYPIAIDSLFAKETNSKIGTTLTFKIQGKEIRGHVVAITRTDSYGLTPQFHVLFSSHSPTLPVESNLITGYVPANQKSVLYKNLLSQDNSITIYDIDTLKEFVKVQADKALYIFYSLVFLFCATMIGLTIFLRRMTLQKILPTSLMKIWAIDLTHLTRTIFWCEDLLMTGLVMFISICSLRMIKIIWGDAITIQSGILTLIFIAASVLLILRISRTAYED